MTGTTNIDPINDGEAAPFRPSEEWIDALNAQASRRSCVWSLPDRSHLEKVGTAVGTDAVGTGTRMRNRLRAQYSSD